MFWDWWAGGGGGWAGLAWLGGWAGGLAGFGGGQGRAGQGRAKQGMQEGRAGQGSAETRFARPLQNRLKAWRERKGGGGRPRNWRRAKVAVTSIVIAMRAETVSRQEFVIQRNLWEISSS